MVTLKETESLRLGKGEERTPRSPGPGLFPCAEPQERGGAVELFPDARGMRTTFHRSRVFLGFFCFHRERKSLGFKPGCVSRNPAFTQAGARMGAPVGPPGVRGMDDSQGVPRMELKGRHLGADPDAAGAPVKRWRWATSAGTPRPPGALTPAHLSTRWPQPHTSWPVGRGAPTSGPKSLTSLCGCLLL